MKILHFNQIDSTNDYCKTIKESDVLVIAKEQLKGRGQHGRSFYSHHNGLFCSYVLKGNRENLTLAVAVAVLRAMKSIEDNDYKIKWVNDIYLNDRKVAGVLCEAVSCGSDISKVIIGVGVNLYGNSYPSDISDIAGDAFSVNVDSEKLAREIVNQLFNVIETDFLNEYRENCMLLGKWIEIDEKPYFAENIGKKGELLCRNSEGSLQSFNSARINIKKFLQNPLTK